MQAVLDTCKYFIPILDDWTTYCILAESKAKYNRYTKKTNKLVWEVIERSLPLILQTRETKLNLREPEIWFIRILYHKLKGKCLDIRQFTKKEIAERIWYEPTDNGLTLSMEEWKQILNPMFKLFRKYKE